MARRSVGATVRLTMNDAPASSHTSAVVDEVQRARADGAPLRIVGAGRWLDAGRPVRGERSLHLPALVSPDIVHYEPGDLTLTVRATATLGEIDRVLRAEGQWLPLDPAGGMDGTIGATIATGSAGPLSSAFGTPREQVLGMEVVTGRGDVIRSGGRVVKNVAGFDVTRLMTGAWGTLGAVTEVSVRLRAVPSAEASVAVTASAADAWRWISASEYTPYAAELVTPALARALGVGDAGTLLVRFGGNDALVRAALQSLATLGEPRPVEGDVWSRVSMRDAAGVAVIRLSARPSRLAPVWERVTTVLERVGGEAHATPRRGVIRCIIPLGEGDEEFSRLRGISQALRVDATLVAERLPAPLWSSLVPSTASDPLSRGIRAAFDPDRILNPGIFGELT